MPRRFSGRPACSPPGWRPGSPAASPRESPPRVRERLPADREFFAGRANHGDQGADLDGLAFGHPNNEQYTLCRRRDLRVNLIGDDLDQRLILGDGLARLLQPLADRAFRDGLAKLRHRDVGGHDSISAGACCDALSTLFGWWGTCHLLRPNTGLLSAWPLRSWSCPAAASFPVRDCAACPARPGWRGAARAHPGVRTPLR